MLNPLYKRFPRELKSEIGKYIVLFVFITGMIAIVSGVLVVSYSMLNSYNESFIKYNVEDGNFELMYEANEQLIETLESDIKISNESDNSINSDDNTKNSNDIKSDLDTYKVKIYENFYIEKEMIENGNTIRIYKNRNEIDKVCLMQGKLPDNKNEIAIDRLYAKNNNISVNDLIEIDSYKFTVSGLVALSDYSALFYSPSDMMFDALKFGVAVVNEESFNSLGAVGLHYNYSWKYDKTPVDNNEAKKISDSFIKILTKNTVLLNYIPQYSNPSIHFAGDDIGLDKNVMAMFLYIVIIIIAFIFAITTNNTILKESTVIGTLRASGYSKGELVRHYITMPMLVVLISAIAGNVLGYTLFEDIAADIYYGSYSFPTYETLWNMNAFIQTTVIPVILIFIINIIILENRLSLSPLKFIRRDLSKKNKNRAVELNSKIDIIWRFRIKIILQNMPNYITIALGIFMANVILLFGIAMPPLLDKNQEDILENMICKYQYVLKTPVQTETRGVEKYCTGALKTVDGKLKSEEVVVYGIVPDSKYVKIDSFDDNSVFISNTLSEKFSLKKGEIITLKEEYGDRLYSFKIKDIYYYPAGISIFMGQEYFNQIFEKDTEFYNGFFSNAEIEDIDKRNILTKITEDDMIKASRQLKLSMGEIMNMCAVFGVIMFMFIIYLLSKIVIEKNAQSISMTKILGYTNTEVSRLYIMATSIVVVCSLVLTIPVVSVLIKLLFRIMLSSYSGWLPYYVPFSAYLKMIASGVAAYSVVAFVQFRRVRRIPMSIALKNVE